MERHCCAWIQLTDKNFERVGFWTISRSQLRQSHEFGMTQKCDLHDLEHEIFRAEIPIMQPNLQPRSAK